MQVVKLMNIVIVCVSIFLLLTWEASAEQSQPLATNRTANVSNSTTSRNFTPVLSKNVEYFVDVAVTGLRAVTICIRE